MGSSISSQELLDAARQQIAAAVEDSSTVRVFLGRWRIIQFRLETLASQLHEIAASCSLAFLESYSLCGEVLAAVLATASDARSVARHCATASAITAKLQTQSRLDALAARFHQHIHDCDVVIKSKDHQSLAILATRRRSAGGARSIPAAAIQSEMLRWAVRDLIARLQIETDPRSKHRALASIVELMDRDDKNVVLIAGQGGIPSLVRLLDAGAACAVREVAASAVCRLARAGCCESELVSENALAPLVRLLESGTGLAKERAASALHTLTYTPDTARCVSAHGGIPPLMAVCRGGTPLAQAFAAGAIKNLVGVAEVRDHVAAEEDAVAVLLGLVLSGTDAAREAASDALYLLAGSYGNTRGKLADVEAILRFLASFPPPQGRHVAVKMLRNISKGGGVAGNAAYNALLRIVEEEDGDEHAKNRKIVSRRKLDVGRMVMALVSRKVSTASSTTHESRIKSFFFKRW